MADPNTRQGKRTPVTLKIKFKSETLEQFIERYAVDVSQGGIFIRTKEPLAVGTQMKFEFQLRDASPLIAGEGTVVWTRENDPSRPAIAPGMGVRFDRLSDGSQPVLERILSEKARQAPQRPLKDTTKPPLFTDTPTRVAPAPVQEALLGNPGSTPVQSRTTSGSRPRSDSMDERTPLPKPMPFHSDADDFSEEAFEEATKVRALDELVAQTALAEPSKPVARPQDELAARRSEPLHEPKPAGAVDRDSAPGLPSPPETSRPTPKVLDTTPSPRESTPSQPPANKTRLGLEAPVPVQSPIAAQSPITPSESRIPSRPPIKDAVTVASGIHAVAQPVEERERRASSSGMQAQRSPSAKRPSSAPIIIGIFLVVAAAGAALWFFVLREPTIEGAKPTNGSNKIVTPGSDVVTPGSGSDTVVNNGSESGSGSAIATNNGGGSGSAEKPAGPTVDTTIASNVDKAAIEIVGTDQKGVAPFVAKLEKDKTYKAKITAPGYLPTEIDVKAGDKPTAKLDAKKFLVTVTSNPPGAAVAIDGVGGKNPYELKAPPKKAIRVTVAKAGFRSQVFMIDPKAWTEDDTTMSFTKDVTLEKAPIVQNPNNGSNTTGSGSGSAKEPTGSGTAPGSGSAPPPPPDEPTPSF